MENQQNSGNYIIFNISSLYPDYNILYIDGIEINRSEYQSGIYYYISIDGQLTGIM